MKARQMLLTALLAVHLFFIFCINVSALAMFDLKSPALNKRSVSIIQASTFLKEQLPVPLQHFIQGYSKYSGISGYVFFSPNPPDSYRLFFSYGDAGNEVIEELPMQTLEGDLRKLCAYDFLKGISDQQFKDLIARSIAARFFELHPGVSDMTMTSFYYQLPEMKDYANGERPQFLEDFSYTFKHTP